MTLPSLLPSLFLSHGAPVLPLTDAPARTFLTKLGGTLARPKAIIVASAHWTTGQPAVNAVKWNDTIHDFYGFPRPLYDLRYPAPGSPVLAGRVAGMLAAAGLDCAIDDRRGLDHGAWVPLLLMYPKADLPVLQLSVQPRLGPAHHVRLGQALAPLRQDGVLIIGSGGLTHSLSEFRGQDVNEPAPPWVDDFADWFHVALNEQRLDDLVNYRRLAPHARKNHPTEEHLMPLYVALGAGGAHGSCERLHASTTHSILRMDVYAFGGAGSAAARSGNAHIAEAVTA